MIWRIRINCNIINLILQTENLGQRVTQLSKFSVTAEKINDKAGASVNPTPHNKIWLSSGRVPLYEHHNYMDFINLSVIRLDADIKKNLAGLGWKV